MQPLFCPNPHCACHTADIQSAPPKRFWLSIGYYVTKVSGLVPRFRCKVCGKTFSSRTFSIDYYTKKSLDNVHIRLAASEGQSLSAIARELQCRSACISNRLDRLGRSAIAFHGAMLETLHLTEDLAADGFESFDRSQYFPNNINLLVGVKSQFLYGATHTTLKRKGRMTAYQKRQRDHYETTVKPVRTGVKQSFRTLIEEALPLWNKEEKPHLALLTDEHKSYVYALEEIKELKSATAAGAFTHRTYSSQVPRTLTNPLFPVNYLDRELRKNLASFRWESTCFTRNVANGMLRFCSHLVQHNYLKDFRVNDRIYRQITHGEQAGITKAAISQGLERLCSERPFLSRTKISPEWQKIWLKQYRTPLKNGADYVPAYARCG